MNESAGLLPSFTEVVSHYFTRSVASKKRDRGEDSSSTSSEENPVRILEEAEEPTAGRSEDNSTTERVIKRAVKMPFSLGPRFSDLKCFINPFDGSSGKYKTFIAECERALTRAKGYKDVELMLLDYIMTILSSLGCKFVNSHDLTMWSEIKEICDSKFAVKWTEGKILRKMTELKQGQLNVFDFYSEFCELIKIYADLLAQESDVKDPMYLLSIERVNKVAAQAFESGLREDIRKSLIFQEHNSLNEVYKLAKRFEEKEANRPKTDNCIVDQLRDILKVSEAAGTSKFSNPQVNHTREIDCQICGSRDHTANDCRKNYRNLTCQLCNIKGHTAPYCRGGGNAMRGGYDSNNRGRPNNNSRGGYFSRNGYSNNSSNNNNYGGNNRGRGGYGNSNPNNNQFRYNNPNNNNNHQQ